MNSSLKAYADKFNAQSLRERGLIIISCVVAISFVWWNYYAEPLRAKIDAVQIENQRNSGDIENTRVVLQGTRQRIEKGVHKTKEKQLAKLSQELIAVEDRLRIKTIELIDPEKMFQLMTQLIYKDSKLKLLSLKRREVKSAIPVSGDPVETKADDLGIYRHVLEIQFSGKYLDTLKYMQSLEALDWKLLWDEIEIISKDYPVTTVKVVISTLSTRKEWVGI
jgi:hypothetical protein